MGTGGMLSTHYLALSIITLITAVPLNSVGVGFRVAVPHLQCTEDARGGCRASAAAQEQSEVHDAHRQHVIYLQSCPRAHRHAWCSHQTACPHPRGRPWGSRTLARQPLGCPKSQHKPSHHPPHSGMSPCSQHASSMPDDVRMPLGTLWDAWATGPTTLGQPKPLGCRPVAGSLSTMRHHGCRVLPAHTETCPVAWARQPGPQMPAGPTQAGRKCGPGSLPPLGHTP